MNRTALLIARIEEGNTCPDGCCGEIVYVLRSETGREMAVGYCDPIIDRLGLPPKGGEVRLSFESMRLFKAVAQPY